MQIDNDEKISQFERFKKTISKDPLIQVLIIICIVSILITLAILIIFVSYFKNQIISDDISHWGNFGDYFGGILNPILSFLNLIFIGFLTIKIFYSEDKREKNSLHNSVRPFGVLFTNIGKKDFNFILSNKGLGPLIITNVKIYYCGKEINNILDALEDLDFNLREKYLTDFYYTHLVNDYYISVGETTNIILYQLSQNIDTKDQKEFLFFNKLFYNIIYNLEYHLEYKDMFNNKMPIAKYNFQRSVVKYRI